MSKVTKRPVYANDSVLESYAFSRSSEQLSEDLTHPAFLDALTQPTGWKFTSYHDKILNEKGLADLTKTIKVKLSEKFQSVGEDEANVSEWIEEDSLNVNACKLHVPPMLFGNDVFRVEFGDFVLSVSGNDALLCWAAQHTKEEVKDRPLDIIKVPYAAKWTARMHDSFGTSNSSNNSSGSGHSVTGCGGGHPGVTPTTTAGTPLSTASVSTDSGAGSVLTTDASSVVSSVRECDWTFSSDYLCSVLHLATAEGAVDEGTSSIERIYSSVAGGVVLRAHSLPKAGEAPLHTAFPTTHNTHATAAADSGIDTAVPAEWALESVAASGIDFEMLKNQDEPILFYDEFILYQDDLEDCGEITLEAKLRVMPQCWFLLVKQFLRVDGARVRCRETRFFHKFSDSADSAADVKIAMDVCWRELAATPVQQAQPSAALPVPVPGHHHGTHAGSHAGAHHPASHGTGIMAGIATGTHPALAGRAPFAPPPQALHSTSGSGVEAQLFGSQGKNLTHLIPVVNEKENIKQHFSIRFSAKSK